MDGETEWESSGWGSTKGIEWMGKHKGKQINRGKIKSNGQ